jgi:peptide methionine sulfoxide reductase MsrA
MVSWYVCTICYLLIKHKVTIKKQNNDIAQLTYRTAIQVRDTEVQQLDATEVQQLGSTEEQPKIQVNPVKKYINSDTEKADIYTENRNKTGIYR